MLDSGANINLQSLNGITPLYTAAAEGHMEAVDVLLRRGAVVDLPNIDGRSPLHSACIQGHEGVLRLLLTAGASTTLEDNQGRCAWNWATAPCNTAVRQVLQEHMPA